MLADGHTMEAVFMADYEGQIADGEAKFFAAHQKGGTGFLISKISGARKNEITFLPNVSTTGSSSWKWGNTGVVPEAKVYYHVVGVWNKEEGKVYVYVNGELKSEIDAVGELVFTDPDTCNWFCVGADPSASGAHCSWTGDVVIARAYDAPLNSKQVDVLWNEIKTLQEDASVDMVSNIDYYSGIAATIGSYYSISGEGFKNGDKIGFNSITDDKNSVVLNCILNDTKGVKVQIPSGFKTDQYRMMLVRDGDMQDLGLTIFNVVDVFPTSPQIIAHRGYWDTDGASQNSLAAIHKAFDLNVYGSELDVLLTTEGYLMLNHDSSYGGIIM